MALSCLRKNKAIPPLRTSRVLRDIREGRQATCVKINITHPNVVELAGLAGASAVWLCNEHGRGLSKDLALAGANLVIASRTLTSCENVAAEIRADGFTATAEQRDQGDEASIISLRDRLSEKFGRVDG